MDSPPLNNSLSPEDIRMKAEAVISVMADAVSIQDRQFRVLYQNKAHRDLVGEHLGNICYEAYQGRNSVCDDCPVLKSFSDGSPHVLEKHPVTPRGQFHVEITASPLFDDDGKVIAGIEVVRNIADRWRAENALRDERNFVSTVLDTVDALVLVLDTEGRIVRFNRACERTTGYGFEEVRGKYVWDLFLVPEEIDGVKGVFKKLTAGMFPNTFENYWVTRDGGRRLISWSNTALVGRDGGVQYVIPTGVDITDKRIMEEELLKSQKIESLGVLAGGIAHDYNNLLTAILGNINLARTLLKKVDPEKAAERLADAERASVRAKDLTRQLLTFSRGGAPVKTATSLSDLVRESAGFALRGSGVRSEFSLPDDLWPIEADEGQISQVMHNLIINAVQSMPEGGTVCIRCGNMAIPADGALLLPKGRYVKVAVQDYGCGIHPGHLPKIFDPYFTTKKKGIGLGLATSYSIVKRHGGLLTVESTLGKGTTFNVYLPAFPGEVKRKAQEPDEGVLEGTGRVLVMDDEEIVRTTAGEMLKSLGYTVELARDGAEAVQRYKYAREAGRPFDAIIMDVTVPGGMGGKDAMKALQKIDPHARAVLSSGYAGDSIIADYRDCGFIDVVLKPYTLQDLGRVLRRIFLGRKTRHS